MLSFVIHMHDSVLLNFPPHTHCVTHSLQCRLYAYKSASSFSIVNFVGRITYRFIAPRASTSVASVWFDDRKRNPLQEPLEPLNWSRLQSISTSCQKMELWLMTHRKRVQWAKFCKLLIISTYSLWFQLGAKPINASPPSVGGGSSPIPW